jgi:hypothetical protein
MLKQIKAPNKTMNTITQHIKQDGFSWFEYNMGAITLIDFSLNELVKRIIQIDPTLN